MTKTTIREAIISEMINDIFLYYYNENENTKIKITENYKQLDLEGRLLINQYFIANNLTHYPIFGMDGVYFEDDVDKIFKDVYEIRMSLCDNDSIYLGDDMYCHVTKGIICGEDDY